MSNNQDFVQWFRSAAPYIKAHRKKTFVILISDEVIDSDRFVGLVHDIALLNHLGIKLVLLHGSRRKIDAHLATHNITTEFNRGVRISDKDSLAYIIQAINEVKTHLESQLSMGLPNTPMSGSEISLVSGNFVTGMPLGVIDGIDMQHSGKVRTINHQVINDLLNQNHIILMSNIGYSRTGEIFNLPAEELATETAKALAADKLVFVQLSHGNSAQADTLSTDDCSKLIQQADTADHLKALLQKAIDAIQSKVRRVHIIDQQVDGGLLLELFTRDGYGTMITNLFYEGIRTASIDDVGGILRLIEPLESTGTLVERSREQLELEIAHFHVIDKDGMIIACVACLPESQNDIAEVACLAVHDDYQGSGFGKQLLQVAEHAALKQNINQLYSLTTRTSHWFIENGFVETSITALPESKQALYNKNRRSKIMIKQI
ncbi:MAG: amino-acid N-acetyltransferase [Gammaproteobacteria bacterium]|nr:amino-acid N-acetyltransferase [Gammaproteobacteria bacterium]